MTMPRRFAALCSFVLCACMGAALLSPAVAPAAPPLATAAQMRPYAGIGVLMLAVAPGDELSEPLQRYDEPGIDRRGELDFDRIPRHEWIFGPPATALPLIVMARKGSWLKVVYDDAGREAWINPGRRGVFQPWDVYFKGQAGYMLPGLQKKYYQQFRYAGSGPPLSGATPRQIFKIIHLDDDWAVVMPDPNSLNRLRWRDEDGRLLIGLERGSAAAKLR